MNRHNTSKRIEALKESNNVERVRKARKLIHDIEALHKDPSDAPEQLRTDVAELVGVADYESAKYKIGERKKPITQCTCSRCKDK